MPAFSLSDIRAMPYEDLKGWWETDFNVLVSTAIAEATGPVHPSVSEALPSEAWLDQWSDALNAACVELAADVDRRAVYNRRLKEARERYGHVEQQRARVNRLVQTRLDDEGWQMLQHHLKDARAACLNLLARQHPAEAEALKTQEFVRRGLDPSTPRPYAPVYADPYDGIEYACTQRLLPVSVNRRVETLLLAPQHVVTRVVAEDVVTKDKCRAELRHPLLLRRWMESLEKLRDTRCPMAGVTPAFTMTLPKLTKQAGWSMTRSQAVELLRHRHFVRALARRYHECDLLTRRLARTAGLREAERAALWDQAWKRFYEALAGRYPEELQALLAAFEPYCEPGSTAIRREAAGAVKGRLIPALKRALDNDTWPCQPDRRTT